MRILIFNLRDIKNPEHGGAEVFTHEISKRWVQQGHQVTLFVSNYKNGCENEKVEGIEIIRRGNIFSVFWIAKRFYKKYFEGKYDIIIDEYTFRPFLTPKFVKEPIIFLVHELAREKYFYELPPILSHIYYYWLEPNWLSYYNNGITVTISESTKSDLVEIKYKNVHIVPVGINRHSALIFE
ncbi:MAG: glycosyltransferase family 4 protein [Methanolinea sp.]